MPSKFLEITFRASTVVPPMVVLWAPESRAIPTSPFPDPVEPSGSRPMMLPWIIVPVAPDPVMLMPSLLLLVITLPSLAPVPPMIVLAPWMFIPVQFPAPVYPVPVVPIQLPRIVIPSAPESTWMPYRENPVIINPCTTLPSLVDANERPSLIAPAPLISIIGTVGVNAPYWEKPSIMTASLIGSSALSKLIVC